MGRKKKKNKKSGGGVNNNDDGGTSFSNDLTIMGEESISASTPHIPRHGSSSSSNDSAADFLVLSISNNNFDKNNNKQKKTTLAYEQPRILLSEEDASRLPESLGGDYSALMDDDGNIVGRLGQMNGNPTLLLVAKESSSIGKGGYYESSSGEDILSKSSSLVFLTALMCQADVSGAPQHSTRTPTKNGSPRKSPRSGTSLSMKVKPGYCRVIPFSTILEECFRCSTDGNTNNDDANDTTSENDTNNVAAVVETPTINSIITEEKTPTVTTPSRGTQRFSFATGGGGDVLITPPSQRQKQKQPEATSSKYDVQSLRVFVIPLPSPSLSLSQHMSTHITNNNSIYYDTLCNHQAYKIFVTVLVEEKSRQRIPNYNRCGQVLERLVIAHYIDQYVKHDQIITISFQGLPLKMRIDQIIIMDSSNNGTFGNGKSNDTCEINTEKQQLQLLNDRMSKLKLEEEIKKETNPAKDDEINSTEKRKDEDEIEDDSSFDSLEEKNENKIPLTSKKEEDALLLEKIKYALKDKNQRKHLMMYKVTYDTQIQYTPQEYKPTDEDKNNNTIHDSNFQPSPLSHLRPPPQYVAGLDKTMDKLKSLLFSAFDFAANNALIGGGVLKPPRGILIHGPSGTGKTSIAKQIASEFRHQQKQGHGSSSSNIGNINVRYVNCASIQSQSFIVGEGEKQLSSLFLRGGKEGKRTNNDCQGELLILDDIHLICARRGVAGNQATGGSDRLASTLLALMDGIDSKKSKSNTGSSSSNEDDEDAEVPLVILGITTDPTWLDPALRRPGRLDIEVEVRIPDDAQTRARIIEFQLQSLGNEYFDRHLITTNDILALAKQAKGFTGADCMLAIKEALRSAIVRGRQKEQEQEQEQKMQLQSSNSGNIGLIDADASTTTDTTNIITFEELERAIRFTKPSTIKSISIEIPSVPWSSIGGMDYAKNQLREAIELPELYGDWLQKLNIPAPKGILLYGPPGCSKTLMARALATEGKMNFLAVKGPELLSKWLGESERALASLFRRARSASPSIIFFDEIDAIASKRENGDGGGSGRLLSQLLTELDGVNHAGGITVGGNNKQQQQPRVVVVGATNRPDLLDDALMRPGRIDRKIYVGVPDEQSRIKILQLGLKNKPCHDDVDIEHLATDEITQGFSGAELIAVCQNAALFALEEADENMENKQKTESVGKEEERLCIRMEHLYAAIRGMDRQITPKMIAFYDSFRRKM